eukprot:jgi/Tetstr1/454948/TSEL_041809.t1
MLRFAVHRGRRAALAVGDPTGRPSPRLARPFDPPLSAHPAKPPGPGTARPLRGVALSARRLATRAAIVNSAAADGGGKRRLVFLGTPQIAANVLQALLDAAAQPGATFEVAAVVTQPGRPTGRKRVVKPSPVEALAREAGLPEERLLTPASARDEDFLEALEAMAPELCVTAAYGNFLPTRFLAIPTFGTLNIHPSLLPAFRGAAPVQRALESGVTTTGVSVAFTVLQMDAGPVLAQEVVELDPNVKAPQLLEELFGLGAALLLRHLDRVWSGEAAEAAAEQDPAGIIHTEKLSKEEALLDFSQPALVLHNKVRGFAGWPGTEAMLQTIDGDGKRDEMKVKVITTRVGSGPAPADPEELEFRDDAMLVACGDGSVLEVLEVQLPGKKVMDAKSFQNGLKAGKKRLLTAPSTAAAV